MIFQTIVFILFLLTLVIFITGPGWYLIKRPKIKSIDVKFPIDKFIKSKEAQFSDIKPNNQSHINWATSDQSKTSYSLIYLHGFSASPKEISPVMEHVSSKLKMNIYFPRLRSHGVTNDLMEILTAEQLFQDAEEAYAIGKALGEKIILVGTSTGASLAVWLAARYPDIAALVLISPNFGIYNWKGVLAAGPLGSCLVRLIAGKPYHSWIPKYPEQQNYWTTHYSINALRAMTDVVRIVEHLPIKKIKVPCLTLWTAQDQVVNIQKSISILKKMGSPKKVFEEFQTPNHVLAGAITSPEHVPRAVEVISKFLQELK